MENKRALRIALSAVAFLCLIVIFICWFNTATTIVVVRHAERVDNSPNTDLSPTGQVRAEELVDVLIESGVASIHTSNFCRTAQTGRPLAAQLGLTIDVQQLGAGAGLTNCNPPITVPTNNLPVSISTEQDLAGRILDQHSGEVVLVVGHSNTVPNIVQELGDGAFSPIQIGSADFDRLFIVTVFRFWGEPRLVKARYGA